MWELIGSRIVLWWQKLLASCCGSADSNPIGYGATAVSCYRSQPQRTNNSNKIIVVHLRALDSSALLVVVASSFVGTTSQYCCYYYYYFCCATSNRVALLDTDISLNDQLSSPTCAMLTRTRLNESQRTSWRTSGYSSGKSMSVCVCELVLVDYDNGKDDDDDDNQLLWVVCS